MTMLEAADGDRLSYLDIASALEERISNTDDHLRNHGFLHIDRHSWRLSPAFDLNPNPDSGPSPGRRSTSIDGVDSDAHIPSALAVAGLFRLTAQAAQTILPEVTTACTQWRHVAAGNRLGSAETALMAPAFEHSDADAARLASSA